MKGPSARRSGRTAGRGHAGQHPRGELVDHRRERLFGQGRQRARRARGGPAARARPGPPAGRSGDHARVKTSQATPERARAAVELAHVDVHAAAVARCRAGPGGTCGGRERRADAWRSDPTGGRRFPLRSGGSRRPDRPAQRCVSRGVGAAGPRRPGPPGRRPGSCPSRGRPVGVPVLFLEFAPEREVDAHQGLLLVLAQRLVGQDQAAEVRRRRPAARGCPACT